MSYTQLGYPAAFASEGNPKAGGSFPGEFDPYVHGVCDTMWVDDETGYFSVDVSLILLFYSIFNEDFC
jgi:leucyl aminopeptidase